MSRYDLTSLSPQDFEELARDLLQAEWNVPLEAFRAGRDHGIDLRYAKAESGQWIVQCKHYAVSGATKLISHLKRSELPKIRKLNPQRYVVFTSARLTVGEKERIRLLLQPFVTTSDIVGAEDIEGLLVRHPAVVRSNFKLWLTSTDVLERVVHNAEYTQSEFAVQKVRGKLPRFVESDALPRAKKLLDTERVAIISGIPGIGKTTLAEMLLFAYLEDGYQAIVIQTDISAGSKLYRPHLKQVFYYDDFLGQIFLGDQRELFGLNRDAALLSFMEMIRANPLSRFILTTREHILQQALQISERFSHSQEMTKRCVLELTDYSLVQRSRILYNHIYFSDLPSHYRNELLREDFYLNMIKHKHFNPRLMEWATSLVRLGLPSVDQFQGRISELLENPEQLWRHAFETQISNEARDLLMSLYLIGAWPDVPELERMFDVVHGVLAHRDNRTISPRDFRSALREMDGAFLSYWRGNVSFLNPSLREYMGRELQRSPALAMQLMACARRFSQLDAIVSLGLDVPELPLAKYLAEHPQELLEQLERLSFGPSKRLREGSQWSEYFDVREEARFKSLARIASRLESGDLLALVGRYVDWLVKHWTRSSADVGAIARAIEKLSPEEWFHNRGGTIMIRTLINAFMEELEEVTVEDWAPLFYLQNVVSDWTAADQACIRERFRSYLVDDVGGEVESLQSEGDLRGMLGTLQGLKAQDGAGVSKASLAIQKRIKKLQDEDDEPESSSSPPLGGVGRPPWESVGEEQIREMFATLRDDEGDESEDDRSVAT